MGYRKFVAGMKEREIWAIFNGDLFDRIVLRGWWIYRQECFMNVETNKVTWRDVPFFRKQKSPNRTNL